MAASLISVPNKDQLRTVTWASISSQFVAGLIWSGLPHFAAVKTGDGSLYGLLFIVSAVAGVIAPFFGGLLPKALSNITIAVATSVATAFCYFLITFMSFDLQPFVIASTLLAASVFATLAGPAFSELLGNVQKQAFKGDLESGAGHYQTFVMIGKMLGFSLGPLAFDLFGLGLLYIISIGYIVEAILLASLRYEGDDDRKNVSASTADSTLSLIRRYPGLIFLFLVNGLLSFPIISYALNTLSSRFEASTAEVTFFWISTSIISVVTNYFISKGTISKVGRRGSAIASTLGTAIAMLGCIYAVSPGALVLAFCLFTFGNPIAMTITRNVAFHAATDTDRRKLFGILQTFAAIGVSGGIVALNLLQSSDFARFFYIFEIGVLALLAARFFSLGREIFKYESAQRT